MVDYLPDTEPNGEPMSRQDRENQLNRLNALLAIESWATPSPRQVPEAVPSEGPWWWRGAEDASASFIESMGITFND